jgi:hypothetical protein
MKEIKIGLKFSEEKGIHFFGIEEVNAEINRGKRIVSIEAGDVFMKKQALDEENVTLTLTGFSISILTE